MGGDLAPRVVIQGALEALRESGATFDVALVGDESVIVEEADRLGGRGDLPRIIHAAERVDMAESAATSVRRKRDSSISVSAMPSSLAQSSTGRSRLRTFAISFFRPWTFHCSA